MLDIKYVRENFDKVKRMLTRRNNDLNIDSLLDLDQKRRDLLTESDDLKSKRNSMSKQIGGKIKAGEDVSELQAEVRSAGDKITELDAQIKEIDAELKDLLLHIPNMPAQDVPVGKDENDNPEIRRWGTPRKFDFTPKPPATVEYE